MATKLEEQFAKMTTAQQKKAAKEISAMMGMPKKSKTTSTKTKKKKK